MTTVSTNKSSDMRIQLSLHIQLSPIPGVWPIGYRNHLNLKLKHIIDGFALEAIELSPDMFQKTAVTIATAHVLLHHFSHVYHSSSYIILSTL